ncbi:MAG: pantoate--beta-alanine ligase [Deltaproteobacteria bacterium]|jgi:pantoate--beta-alanine ligase|nr:pantoate--beta-alanine ligase [Deltaproteobacteria bacterium]
METIASPLETQKLCASWRAAGLKIGLVPTMGYLHAGHESLIVKALAESDRVVVSIFVNPTQFGPKEDLDKYPRDFQRDQSLCRSLGVSLIFAPSPDDMYPAGFATKVAVPSMAATLCGRNRPNHFDGVCLVCSKLFNVVGPRKAYFGLKDAQQYFVLARMVRDLNLDLELVPCPTVREPDGLALSSRNAYLNEAERKAATVLSRALDRAKGAALGGQRDPKALIDLIAATVAEEPLARLEYAQVVATGDLADVSADLSTIDGEILVAAALWLGQTRLIDNFLFTPPEARR